MGERPMSSIDEIIEIYKRDVDMPLARPDPKQPVPPRFVWFIETADRFDPLQKPLARISHQELRVLPSGAGFSLLRGLSSRRLAWAQLHQHVSARVPRRQPKRPMPLTLDPGGHPGQIVGQPILAAAGFQPALCRARGLVHGPKEPPERRLRARLPAPQLMQKCCDAQSKWHWPKRLRLNRPIHSG